MIFNIIQKKKKTKSDIITEFRIKTTHVVIKVTKTSNKTINNINNNTLIHQLPQVMIESLYQADSSAHLRSTPQ